MEHDTVDPNYSDALRQEVLESTEGMIRQIEREVAVYLAAKYGVGEQKEEETEREAPMERELVSMKKAA